ncbi:MAG: serine hydrolase, partial [Spirochaetaceae bacterium]|nr:serine hydrolase [Spirochaetaceae bacterium]
EPSGGGVGDARSLAKIYGMLATKPEELGITPETLSLMTDFAPPAEEGYLDAVMGFESHGSRLGHLKPDAIFDFGSESAFGFSGTGGSFAFADPDYGVGFAYVMTKMDYYGINDPRETALREALYRSVLRQQGAES